MAALTLVRYILISMGVLFVLSQLQLGPTTLAAITGGLSVGVGFGLREILSNLISGILLLFEQSLHPGDVIEVDDEITVVEDVRMRATIVRTQNNDELVIPNQTFFTSSFKTYTGTDKTVRVPLIFRTDCTTPPREVIRVLTQTALSHVQVLREPPPTVFVLDYGDNTAQYQLNIWLDNPVLNAEVASDIRLLVWDAFEENGIALPFPEIELHLPRQMAPELRPIFTS
jgi:small-conductance mechanosensitive channel